MDNIDEDLNETDDNRRKKRGKRQIYFSCAANVNSQLVLKLIPVTTPQEGEEFNIAAGKQEAINAFVKEYNVNPLIIEDPIYIRKGLLPSVQQKKKENVVTNGLKFTSKHGSAISTYKNVDYNVSVNCTEDPNKVFVVYGSAVSDTKTKIRPPTGNWLNTNELKDLKIEL